MKSIWLLEGSQDNRDMFSEVLAKAGFAPIAFASVDELLAHAAQRDAEPPAMAVVDARTACECEQVVCAMVPSRVVVMTTWPTQFVPWANLGVSRLFIKPFDCARLIEHAGPP
jgi:hypothetical protein